MSFRRLLRGTAPWPQLEGIARAVLSRYDRPAGHVRFLEAGNWLSTPTVIRGAIEQWAT